MWRPSLDHFAARGWRVVAPDMRGYHGSSIPTRVSDHAMSEGEMYT
jgi:pimeloyl-ACP methyl ester carboxylesterase